MAEERIDIEVTDKVDANAAKKINQIADAAERGANYVDKLKAALANVNTSGTDRLVSAMARADSAAARLLNAQVRLTQSQDQGAIAAAKLATQEQKLATETARTSAAQARAAAATAQAEAATARLAAAQQRTINTTQQAGTGFAALDRYIGATGSTANRTRANMANLAAQFQDIGVSLAGGQNPFLVFIQQGSQISYIASQMEGGWKGLASAATGWVVVSKTVATAATEEAAANLAAATAAQTQAAAEAQKAVIQANVVLAQQALTAATAEVAAAETLAAAAASELSLATIGLSVNQALAAAAAEGDVAAQNMLAAALARVDAAQASATLASANTAAANLAQAEAATALAGAQNAVATSAAGTTRAFSGLAVLVGSLLAIFGTFYAIYKTTSDEIREKGDPAMKAYANTLGLTDKELRKLNGSTVDANGKLKEHDQLVITAGDSWNGFKSAVSQGIEGMVAGWGGLTDYFSAAWSAVINFLYNAFLGFYAAVLTLLELLGKTFVNVFKIAANVVIGIVNGVTMAIEWAVNKAIQGINLLADGANTLLSGIGFGDVIPKLDEVKLGVDSITQSMFQLESMDIGATFANRVQEANNTIQGFKQAWDEAANAAARARIAALAASIIENRNPAKGKKAKIDHTAENRALAIGLVNLKLDDELSRMKLLKDAREVQQRMDTIEQELARKKITLNDAERASILAKVQAIQDYKYVQQESDRIMEEINGPARTYAATQQALNELLAQGAISQENFAKQTVLADRAFQASQDPLMQMKESLDASMVASKAYGVELDKVNYYEQIRQAFLAKGVVLSQQYVAGQNAEVDALIRKNDQLRQQQYIQSQLAGVLNPVLDQQMQIDAQASVYAELDRLRQDDLIKEDAYQQAKAALWVKYNEAKLQASSDFFGALADVTKKGTGVVGAISKAAAVAEATIQGYLAVQKALASMPPPFNYVAAAAVAIKTGANVAGILSTNAGSFATGGQFMVEGKSGVDANNINMNVTRGERVTVETPAQQRAADSQGNGSGETPMANVKILNSLDPRIALDAVDTAEGEQLIVNIITRNAPAVKRVLG
jgi:hypothetical protein